MNEKDIKRHMDLAKKILKKKFTKEEALHTFVMAGILNWDGEFTDHFPHLAAAVAAKKIKDKCTASDQI